MTRWKRTSRKTLGAVLVAGALFATACGDDSSDSTTGGTGGGFSGPLTIGTLWEIQGESEVAIDEFENAAKIAIEEINAADGVGGMAVERFRVPASVLDLQKAQAAFLEAVDKNPSVIVGFALPAQLQAAAQQIARSGIPVLGTTNGQPFLRYGTPDGSDYLWVAKTYDPAIVAAGVDYLVDDLGLENIGLMATNESNGQGAVDAAKARLKEKNLEPFAVAQYDPTATDLTPQVLAMKGADAVIHWGFPNTIGVQLQQFAANGLDIPTMSSDAAPIAVTYGLASGDVLENLYVSAPCNPLDPKKPSLEAFAKKYREAYGEDVTVTGAMVYDAIHIAAEAARIAGSSDPSAINTALASVEHPDGTCGNYKADGAHMMNHESVIARYKADGSAETLKTTTLPDQDAQ